MVAKQVIFRDISSAIDTLPVGGIALYEDYGQGKDYPALELQGVICGECGAFITADDCEIITVCDIWWTLADVIDENIRPDGTRGFRI